MKPKKANTFIEEVAKKNDVSEHFVKALTNFYWEKVLEHLTQVPTPHLKIDNLGTFTARTKKLKGLLNRLVNRKAKLEELITKVSSIRYYAGIKHLERRIETLRKTLKELEIENESRNIKKKNRHESK